ncbi:hypothetical protein BCE_4334 [Bacillus cereus ATCC 10987]|uniref:Uncharacterized protein n=1 Tax=Bacillus cereus (strain ATCC 10987 / NRS 248) TaxID=222523 RepID=Q730T2_BACC1|nr:hypothetical protein BCE_4334 [Bacillus cereus ATCC 10987]
MQNIRFAGISTVSNISFEGCRVSQGLSLHRSQ